MKMNNYKQKIIGLANYSSNKTLFFKNMKN